MPNCRRARIGIIDSITVTTYTVERGFRQRGLLNRLKKGLRNKFRNPLIILVGRRGLESVLSRLLLLKEAYPELKANESFLKLQDSLEGTENRIAVERRRYNDAVRVLNTYRRTFFGRFFTAIAGVEAAEYYEPPEKQKENIKVKF